MHLNKFVLTLFALNPVFTGSLSAAVVYSNGLPNQSGGSDLNLSLGADDFSLLSNATINLIRFWTLQADTSSYAGSMEWSIRSDAAGTPGAIVASGLNVSTQSPTGNSFFGLKEFVHEVPVLFNLAAGNFWLALHNGPSGTQVGTEFYWAFHDDQSGNGQAYELPAPGAWGSIGAELAFELEGKSGGPAVPEPGSVVLLASGLAWLASRRFRRIV